MPDLTLPMLILFGIALIILLVIALAVLTSFDHALNRAVNVGEDMAQTYRDEVYSTHGDDEDDDEPHDAMTEVDHALCKRRDQLRFLKKLPSDDEIVEELL